MASKVAFDHGKLAELCRRHGIRKLALFGSVLREDFGPTSDIDVLIEFEPDRVPGFFGLHRIECEIAALFGKKSRSTMRHDDRVYLRHMLEMSRKARELAAGESSDDFDSDEALRLELRH